MRDIRFNLKLMEEKSVKRLCLVLTLALVLVGAFSAVAMGATPNPLVTTPTVDRLHPAGYDGQGGTSQNVNAHGGFTINGDTCSVCHSMHYAGNGFNLTLATSTTNESMACLACHDGTTRNYNIINGKNGAGDLAMGGLFANYAAGNSADPADAASGSMHDAFGTVEAYIAAPGGRGANTDFQLDGKTPVYDLGTWVAGKLTCGSCHDAHIAINPRLLSTNPNGIMDNQVKTAEAAVKADGTTAQTYNADPATKYWFAKAPAADIVVKVDGTELEYVKDYQVKWEALDSVPNTKNDAGGSIAPGARAAKPGYMSVFKEDHAYVVITKTGLTADAAVTLDYKPAFTVQMKISNYNATGETVQYGKGVENFCTACHTDFKGSKQKPLLDANGQQVFDAAGNKVNTTNTGVFGGLGHHTGDRPNEGIAVLGNYTPESVAHGDTAKESIGSCLTCHFAHGTNQARWAAVSTAAGYVNPDGTAIYNVAETVTGSAANKRLPNSAMCVLCHDMVSTNGSGNSKN